MSEKTTTGGVDWRAAVAPYTRPRIGRSLLDLATSVAPYLALSAAMYALLDVSYWLALVVALPAAGFLLRTFIVFHDCAHGSFLPSKRANTWLGRVLGILVYQAFADWRHHHAVHHATAGDLDRRGVGDVLTLTVAEYQEGGWRRRVGYWLFRHPLVMFGLGPLWAMILQPRIPARGQRRRLQLSVLATDAVLVVAVGALCWAIGWKAFLLVQGPTALLAGAAGVWLFYVQHQFEDTYWADTGAWSYADAALHGSSYLKLPQPLQFFTGNIGLHHVHHLSARIPNYNLQRAHDELEIFRSVPVLTLWGGLKAVRLKLWDERSSQLVTFAEARAGAAAPGAQPARA